MARPALQSCVAMSSHRMTLPSAAPKMVTSPLAALHPGVKSLNRSSSEHPTPAHDCGQTTRPQTALPQQSLTAGKDGGRFVGREAARCRGVYAGSGGKHARVNRRGRRVDGRSDVRLPREGDRGCRDPEAEQHRKHPGRHDLTQMPPATHRQRWEGRSAR